MNWEVVKNGLTEDFTFTSPYDDHLNIKEFKEKCWDSVKQIGEFEIVKFAENENEKFVRYKNTINGEKVQNVEHLVFDEEGKLKSVTVFFGLPE